LNLTQNKQTIPRSFCDSLCVMMAADNLLNTVRAFYEDFFVVELCVRFKTCKTNVSNKNSYVLWLRLLY